VYVYLHGNMGVHIHGGVNVCVCTWKYECMYMEIGVWMCVGQNCVFFISVSTRKYVSVSIW